LCIWSFIDAATFSGLLGGSRFVGVRACVGIPMVFVWAFCLLLAMGAPLGRARLRRWRWVWIASPVLLLLALILFITDTPDRVRLLMSKSSLDAFAQDMLRTRIPCGPRWVGMIKIDGAGIHSGCVYLKTGWDGIDPKGIAYCPQSQRPHGHRRPLIGDWYLWAD
jgi:hypothetical protein